MSKSLTSGKIAGHVTINGTTYELLQMGTAVWIVNPDSNRSIQTQFKNREMLLSHYPNARFGS